MQMGEDIVFPAAAFMSIGVEALYQASQAGNPIERSELEGKYRYRLRNVTFSKALVLTEDTTGRQIMTTLMPSQEPWFEFRISSLTDETWNEHSRGLISLEDNPKQGTCPRNQPSLCAKVRAVAAESTLAPLQHPVYGSSWYKAMHEAGYNFGPLFQKVLEIESLSASRNSRSKVSLALPMEEIPQSYFPLHPVCMDGCLQTVVPSLWAGNRAEVNAVLIPAIIDGLVINPRKRISETGISMSTAA